VKENLSNSEQRKQLSSNQASKQARKEGSKQASKQSKKPASQPSLQRRIIRAHTTDTCGKTKLKNWPKYPWPAHCPPPPPISLRE